MPFNLFSGSITGIWKNQFIFIIIICILFLSGVPLQSSAQDLQSFMGMRSNHVIKDISTDWELHLPILNITQTVDIPCVFPKKMSRVIFDKTFNIPDSLNTWQLGIWCFGINGISEIKLNNILILKRENLPSPFKIIIPPNLLNINGQNSLEIHVRIPESHKEGIPDMVQVFKPAEYLGITGEMYLEWIPDTHISDLAYQFRQNTLSIEYKLNISENSPPRRESNPKIRCQEEIFDPNGQVVFRRFEYFDHKKDNKNIKRIIKIASPFLWSDQLVNNYRLRLTVNSGTGMITYFEQKIALKNTYLRNGRFFVNQIPIRLDGINYRINYPTIEIGGNPHRTRREFYAQLKQDFIDIKHLGFNAIRFPNHVPHPYCFYLADSLGLYLFPENSLWRLADTFYKNDDLLKSSKQICDEMYTIYGFHPSFTALGLGSEVPLHIPSVKKFYLILKQYIDQKSTIPVYLSPLNLELLDQKPITDFYIINKYDTALLTDFQEISASNLAETGTAIYFGNAGFAIKEHLPSDQAKDQEIQQSEEFQMFFHLINDQSNIGGFFIESYRDWESAISARLAKFISPDRCVYPYGLISWDGRKRMVYDEIPDLIENKTTAQIIRRSTGLKSNFFSISVFIISIIFLVVYQQNYRFRENIKRSLSHPYGFFVDLRDRRIISILNSSLIGLFTNFLISVLIAAYLYWQKDNLMTEEYISAILVPLNLKLIYLELSSSPFKLTLFIWLFLYILQLFVVIFMKFLNIFSKEKIRFRQYLAVCNWAGAPLMLLIPVSMLSFHLLKYDIFNHILLLILLLSFIWYNFRLGNGLRVILSIRIPKIFILIVLTYSSVLVTFGVIFESNYGLITYLRLLADSNPLF